MCEVKKNILKISFKCFVERGFLEVSINELAKEVGITPRSFYNYFSGKNQLIFETIEKFLFPYYDDIARITDKYNKSPKKMLIKIFRKFSEIENYLKNNFSIHKISHNFITFLTIEGIKKYEPMIKYIVDFNNRLLNKIETIIEAGKRQGEISSMINSKSNAIEILTLLQSTTVLWIMNQNIDIKVLFEISFKHLWNSIKSK